MTREEVFQTWAISGGRWSDWVKPVLFAQMPDRWQHEAADTIDPAIPICSDSVIRSLGQSAIVVDLPGLASVEVGLALAGHGYQPVPLYNGAAHGRNLSLSGLEGMSEGVSATINVWPMMRALWKGAGEMASLKRTADALPAFLLDSRRRLGERGAGEGLFDNRWLTFPTDFPSGRMLLEAGIENAVALSGDALAAGDLAHVLLRWEKAGIQIWHFQLSVDQQPRLLKVYLPNHFQLAWYNLLATFGLKRNLFGGFGGTSPSASGG